jgi:hypothetical protein
MVRSEITVNELSGAFANHETADAIDKGNDHVIAEATNFKRLILSFELSAATAADTITIVAGTAHPAFRRGLGDLVFEAAGGAERVCIGPIEPARYLQADGTIHIDIAGTSIAGTIDAYSLP